MTSNEIRQKFREFFEAREHAFLDSAPLVTEDNKGVVNKTLFNGAGVQPLIPYILGEKHPQGNRLASSQKCIRTVDIEDVGDATHLTFFEMLGNWSLGDYFKKDAIKWSYDLLTSKEEGFGLDPQRLYVSVFAGDENVGADEETKNFWIEAGVPENRIYYLGSDANWWPNVDGEDTWTGPTGPSTEMFYDLTEEGLGDLSHDEFVEADDTQKLVEIWNDVFMTYEKENGKIVGELTSKNVDTGAGLERLAAVLQKKDNVFETDLFESILKTIPEGDEKSRRIIADHTRASVFLISDGVLPSNTDRGYILRRLLRRVVRHADKLEVNIGSVVEAVINQYGSVYSNISQKSEDIREEIKKEEEKFRKTLNKGLKEFEKIKDDNISGSEAFKLFSTYGFPIELTIELAKEQGLEVDKEGFDKEFAIHQEKSKEGSDKKFKGGLGDDSEMSVKYHTATHLLHQALHDVLGDSVEQKGSNITPERLRFDFSHDKKLTIEEKQKVEDIVNEKISAGLPVNKVVMSFEEAEKTGAHHFFADKYGNEVSVYYIGDSIEDAYSKEFCGGPHVENTKELGKFRIKKEEASSAGVRRIKAVLE